MKLAVSHQGGKISSWIAPIAFERTDVRVATASDFRDPDWRQLDPCADTIEEPIAGKDYGDSYPEDAIQLYYWRHNSWHRKA